MGRAPPGRGAARGVILDLPAKWRASILVCAKCEKKLEKKGFGPKGNKRLSKLLRKRFGGGWGRKAKVGVISTGCLKVCPRYAVTVSMAPDRATG